jgi:hypothetical protein
VGFEHLRQLASLQKLSPRWFSITPMPAAALSIGELNSRHVAVWHE